MVGVGSLLLSWVSFLVDQKVRLKVLPVCGGGLTGQVIGKVDRRHQSTSLDVVVGKVADSTPEGKGQ